jgi:arylsulfatase A-like enzyme
VTGPEVTDIAIDLLRAAPPDRAVFLWVHYVDPHHKYVRHPGFPASAHPARGVYDGEVAFTVHQIGRLLDEIAASSGAGSTAIVLTADHGEAFGEHGVWRHGTSVFEEEVRVPLMVHVPGLPPSQVQTPRSTIDVAPTIAALLDAQQPARWRGRSLLEPDGPDPRAVLVDCPALMNAPARRVAIMGRYKVVESAGWTSAFDLEHDPEERDPIAVDTAESVIASARNAFASINSVAARKCARQAFRPPE